MTKNDRTALSAEERALREALLADWIAGTDLPATGWIEGLEMPDYLIIPAASNSLYKVVHESPLSAWWHLSEPSERKPPTPAQKLGTAIHACILEPDTFRERYLPAGRCTATLSSGANKGKRCTNEGKVFSASKGWFCGTHGKHVDDAVNRIVLPADEFRTCLGIRDYAFTKSTRVRNLLSQPGRAELTGVWRDEVTGVPVKLRADWLTDRDVLADVKSFRGKASRREASLEVARRGYYRQQGDYVMGSNHLGRTVRNAVVLFAEKEPPWAVVPFRLDDNVLAAGAMEARLERQTLARCMETGEWPSAHPDRIQSLGLPAWKWRELEARGIDPLAAFDDPFAGA